MYIESPVTNKLLMFLGSFLLVCSIYGYIASDHKTACTVTNLTMLSDLQE